ncbi:MAG TPA: 3-isopropylmalate dehydratase small subunit [Burkholderiaceae bacterium]|nr:3-isopropylmalate dehydratase small subunit [Burkholderiaceae bacterium]
MKPPPRSLGSQPPEGAVSGFGRPGVTDASDTLVFEGLVAPLDRENVDTDAIIPKQFLKSTQRTGYGDHLFDAWRFMDVGEPGKPLAQRTPNAGFVLNQPRYRQASILLARNNFGCGSSREHAPWAMLQYGLRAVIAPGFGDIFRNNALKNGLLAIVLPEQVVDGLFDEVRRTEGYMLQIDLPEQTVRTPAGTAYTFEFDAFRKRCLMQGIDEVSLALAAADEIRAWERRTMLQRPWSRLPRQGE